MDPMPDGALPATFLARRRRRCAICSRRLRQDALALTEQPGMPERRGWVVCGACHEAVRHEMQRSPVQSPYQLRVAVGVVASERQRPPRLSIWSDRFWNEMTDERMNRLLVWCFIVAFAVHALAFIAVAAYIAVVH